MVQNFTRPFDQHRQFPRKKVSGANNVATDRGNERTFAGFDPNKKREEQKNRRDRAKELKRKKWRLIVRNLPFKCEKADIESVFKKFGALNEVVVPRKNDRNAGFCFVQFRDFPSAVKALKDLNMKEIKGRSVAIDWAVPKDNYETAVHEEKSRKSDVATETVIKEEPIEDTKKEELPTSEVERESEENSDDASGSSDGESGSSSEGDDDEEGDDDQDSKSSSQQKGAIKVEVKPDAGVTEGRTIFVRNLSFDTTDEDLREFFEKYGELRYAVVCKYADTEHSKGSGFVQYVEKSGAEKCLEASYVDHQDGTSGFKLDKRRLIVCPAIERGKAKEMEKSRHEKQPKDKRNLHLLRVGLIRQGTREAAGMSESDALKRLKVEQQKRMKIKNLHVFVSATRLCIHNLPTPVDDTKLEKICLDAVEDSTARLIECRVMRDLDRVSTKGLGKSRGFAFVEFSEHKHALKCLQKLNNSPDTFTDAKRPIVEFSLENKTALNKKAKRLDKSRIKLAAIKGELPKKKPKLKTGLTGEAGTPKGFETKVLTDVDVTKKQVAAGGKKPLPSHLGPKIRHKKRKGDQTKDPRAEKRNKRKMLKKSRSEKRGENGKGVKGKADKRKATASAVDKTTVHKKIKRPRKEKKET